MREIKPQTIRGNKRSCLIHMRTKYQFESRIKKVRCGVVAADKLAAAGINRSFHNITGMKLSLFYLPHMGNKVAFPVLCIAHLNKKIIRRKRTGIPYLTAHLRIEWRTVKHYLNFITHSRAINFLPVFYQSDNPAAFQFIVVITVKDRFIKAIGKRHPHGLRFAPRIAIGTRTRALLLLCHCSFKLRFINDVSRTGRNLARKVNGKTVGVMKQEGHVSGKTLISGKLFQLIFQFGLTGFKRCTKSLFFCRQNAFNKCAFLNKLRICISKQAHDLICIFSHKCFLDTHKTTVIHRAAQESP